MGKKTRSARKTLDCGSLKKNLKTLKPILSSRFHVKRLGLFGSYVRGQMRRSSDIDVLVEFSRRVDLLDFVALEKYLADQTGVKIDLVSAKAIRPEFRGTILDEVVYI